MGAISETLGHDLAQPEFSEGYAEAFQSAYVATQIKVLREQNEWTQAKLAEKLNTTQTVVSRIENVNYSAWNISTLRKIARAFRLRLHISFETYGSLICEMDRFSRENLKRKPREEDPALKEAGHEEPWGEVVTRDVATTPSDLHMFATAATGKSSSWLGNSGNRPTAFTVPDTPPRKPVQVESLRQGTTFIPTANTEGTPIYG